MEQIDAFVNRLWPWLVRGEKFEVAMSAVEHPSTRPDLFAPPPGAWPVGQTCDYVWRLPQGGRIHVQCFSANGLPSLRFHFDKFDPERSADDFVKHGIHETPIGPLLALGAVVGVFALVVAALVKMSDG